MREIIDISEHNVRRGAINWPAVKSSGITGVMIRIGWAGYEGYIAGNNAIDPSLDASIRGAHASGLDVGLYVYMYTKSPTAAKIAAAECVEIAKRYPGMINLPIAGDFEETALNCLVAQGRAGLTSTVIAFLDEVKRLGYQSTLYTYTSFIVQYLDASRVKNYELWIADYRGNEALMQSQIGRSDYGIWQYVGDKGICPGVNGACDLNYCYKDYPEEIAAAGLNGLVSAPKDATDYKTLYLKAKSDKENAESIIKQIYDLAKGLV